jgi:hypothetical protein
VQAVGPIALKREIIEPCAKLSIRQQCELLGISRSSFYYEPVPESEENLSLMRRLDELHLDHPSYGSRRLCALLAREGQPVNRKRVARLLEVMGIEAVYPKRHLSQPGPGHRIYPYLLELVAKLELRIPRRRGTCRGCFYERSRIMPQPILPEGLWERLEPLLPGPKLKRRGANPRSLVVS